MGRDEILTHDLEHRPAVSIHAPAWGATLGEQAEPLIIGVSIHAPAWGATCCRPLMPSVDGCFNPRARMGRDTSA